MRVRLCRRLRAFLHEVFRLHRIPCGSGETLVGGVVLVALASAWTWWWLFEWSGRFLP